MHGFQIPLTIVDYRDTADRILMTYDSWKYKIIRVSVEFDYSYRSTHLYNTLFQL